MALLDDMMEDGGFPEFEEILECLNGGEQNHIEAEDDLRGVLFFLDKPWVIPPTEEEVVIVEAIKNQATKGLALIQSMYILQKELDEAVNELLTAAEPFWESPG